VEWLWRERKEEDNTGKILKPEKKVVKSIPGTRNTKFQVPKHITKLLSSWCDHG
jgi:hypothetical protein